MSLTSPVIFILRLPDGDGISYEVYDENALKLLEFLHKIGHLEIGTAPLTRNARISGSVPADQAQITLDGCAMRANLGEMWQQNQVFVNGYFGPDEAGRYPEVPEHFPAMNLVHGLMLRAIFTLGILPILYDGSAYLLHGALAKRNQDGAGILFCGPSGMGKSTTAYRLNTENYEVLGDDCVLLTRHNGRWHGQAVPTWSIWTTGKPARTFEMNKFVPIEQIYLLERGETALLELSNMERITGLTPSFCDIIKYSSTSYPDTMKHHLLRRSFEGANYIVKEVPMARLRLNLEEDFQHLMKF